MPKLGIGIGLSSGKGKRVAVYKATGSGLSPGINGMIFYDTGTLFNGRVLYASNEGYFLFRIPAGYWAINKTKTTGSGIGQFNQIPPAAEPTSKTYGGNTSEGYTGTVTIVKI